MPPPGQACKTRTNPLATSAALCCQSTRRHCFGHCRYPHCSPTRNKVRSTTRDRTNMTRRSCESGHHMPGSSLPHSLNDVLIRVLCIHSCLNPFNRGNFSMPILQILGRPLCGERTSHTISCDLQSEKAPWRIHIRRSLDGLILHTLEEHRLW